MQPSVRQRLRQCRGLRLAVTRLGGTAERSIRRLSGDPVDAPGGQFPAEQLVVIPQHHGVVRLVLGQHIHMLAQRDAKALALPDGIAGKSPVPAQYMAFLVHKIARLQRDPLREQEGHIVAVRDKADILTVGFIGVQQPGLPGAAADEGLVVIPHRQQQMGELILGQLIQHIALILASVTAPQQPVQACFLVICHPGVVPCGDVVIAQRHRPVQQRTELQAAVAVDAGVGCTAGTVLRREMLHHVPAKSVGLVEHIKLHAQPVGHGPGVLGVVGTAAAAVAVGDQLQHGTVAVIALLPQQQRRGGAVHAAGHGHQYPLAFCLLHRFTSLCFGIEYRIRRNKV